jgi:hypothetical protein
MRRETVRSGISMPSLKSSPWMRGAPHWGCAAAIVLTSAATSVLMGRRRLLSGAKGGSGGRPGGALGRLRSLVDGELLTQGQVLESELAVAAENEGKESE